MSIKSTPSTQDVRAEALAGLARAFREYGFLTRPETDAMTLAGGELARVVVLVRCGAQRFTCEVRDLRERIDAVEQTGDYIRDVSMAISDQPRVMRIIRDYIDTGAYPDTRTDRQRFLE